ncbi:unnamed protein product [Lampetra fluviatilis]
MEGWDLWSGTSATIHLMSRGQRTSRVPCVGDFSVAQDLCGYRSPLMLAVAAELNSCRRMIISVRSTTKPPLPTRQARHTNTAIPQPVAEMQWRTRRRITRNHKDSSRRDDCWEQIVEATAGEEAATAVIAHTCCDSHLLCASAPRGSGELPEGGDRNGRNANVDQLIVPTLAAQSYLWQGYLWQEPLPGDAVPRRERPRQARTCRRTSPRRRGRLLESANRTWPSLMAGADGG